MGSPLKRGKFRLEVDKVFFSITNSQIIWFIHLLTVQSAIWELVVTSNQNHWINILFKIIKIEEYSLDRFKMTEWIWPKKLNLTKNSHWWTLLTFKLDQKYNVQIQTIHLCVKPHEIQAFRKFYIKFKANTFTLVVIKF